MKNKAPKKVKEKFAKTNFPQKLQTSHEEHFENSSKKEENRNYSNFSKEIKIPMKFNAGTQKYEADFEKLNEQIEKVNQRNKLINGKKSE